MASGGNSNLLPAFLMAFLLAGNKVKEDTKELPEVSPQPEPEPEPEIVPSYTPWINKIYSQPAMGLKTCIYEEVPIDPDNTWVSNSGYLRFEIDKDAGRTSGLKFGTWYQLRVQKVMTEPATMTLSSYVNWEQSIEKILPRVNQKAGVVQLKKGDRVWLANNDCEARTRCGNRKGEAGFESRSNLDRFFNQAWRGISQATAKLPTDQLVWTTCGSATGETFEVSQMGYIDTQQSLCCDKYWVDGLPAYPYIGNGNVRLDYYKPNEPFHGIYKPSTWDDIEGLKYLLEDIAIKVACAWLQGTTGIPEPICAKAIRGGDISIEDCTANPEQCANFLSQF
jgi:hypothetical protein